MRRLSATFLLVLIAWLMLTNTLGIEFLAAGIIISLAISLMCRHILSRETPEIFLHPMRWLGVVLYIADLAWQEIVSHVSVARSILTGRIRPAIVEVDTDFKTPLGKTMFANSVTLTPGTLTIRASRERNSFFIHTLNHRQKSEPGASFKRFGRRVMG